MPDIALTEIDPLLVSVVTPVFNAAHTLARCHASVESQVGANWEHILVDDGSSDGSRDIILELAANDPKVRFVLSDATRGAGLARNAGIDIARGRYMAFLDADDEWMPEKLSTQLAFMNENAVDLSYGSYHVVRNDVRDNAAVQEPPAELTYEDLLAGCPIGCLTAMYDRYKTGTRDFPDIARGQDWALWLEFAKAGYRIARYPGVHAVYHSTTNSLSSNKLAKIRDVWTIYRSQPAMGPGRALYWLSRHLRSLYFKRQLRP